MIGEVVGRGRRRATVKAVSEDFSRRRPGIAVLGATMVLAVTLSGCPVGRERICSGGEHVVRSIEAPETGRTCVRDGKPPPKGYEEYPPGQVPKYTDQD